MWDHRAAIAIKSKSRPEKFYFGESFLNAIARTVRFAVGQRLSILKTDLWNEGIESERDILSKLSHNDYLGLIGIDLSRNVCHLAHKRLPSASIVRSDVRNLPFRDESFDVVLDLSTIDHVSPDHVAGVIREYQRSLKESSLLLLIFVCPSAIMRLIRVIHKPHPHPEFLASPYQYEFPVDQTLNIVERAQFNILEKYWTIAWLEPKIAQLARMNPRLAKVAYAAALRAENATHSGFFLKHWSGLFVIIARKTKVEQLSRARREKDAHTRLRSPC